MIYSMTGYATVAHELPEGVLNIELRAVNHRFLDIQVRMPEELRFVEPSLRELFTGKVSRGKVECRLGYSPAAAGATRLELNEALTRQLGALNRQVQALLPDSEGLRVVDVLRWPGVLAANALPLDAMRDLCTVLAQSALDEFNGFRAREGERLKTFLLDRVARMEALVGTVAPRMPQVLASYQEKLATRLKEAIGSADDDRIRQELALFMTRSDVDEEISRLNAHLTEVRRVLDRGGTVGKRLDFLMQELNREANTLGSKAADNEVSQTAVELKVLIEQMREQVQNVE
ncbi:MAG: YicC family protein [Burkholderiales bacterium]|jgi:uncharacterized protein (TIGR00255 family)|nr:YicC family protein [Burkholderiales bacterium]